MNTADCQIFLSNYYNQMKFETQLEEWELIKKYKNFHGLTCRDFLHKELELKAIVVMSVQKNQLSVIENANYEFFLKDRTTKLFYYVPVNTVTGLSYYFAKKSLLDKHMKLTKFIKEDQELLYRNLKSVFRSHDFIEIKKDMLVNFPDIDVEVIIKKLDTNNFSFNPKLFELLNSRIYEPYYPDLSSAIYNFPDDSGVEQEEAIELILNICSQLRQLNNEDYARIVLLLKKVSLDETIAIGKIMIGFRSTEDTNLKELIEEEVNRKKSISIFAKKRIEDD